MAEEKSTAPFIPLEAKSRPPVIVDPPASEATVLMIFPHRVRLTLKGGRVYEWKEGPGNVPIFEGADKVDADWWLAKNGVKPYDGSIPMKWNSKKPVEVTERHAAFLRANGFPVANVDEAKNFLSAIDQSTLPAFFEDANSWDGKEAEASPVTAAVIEPAPVVLSSMTKEELVAHAKAEHDLQLDGSLKKAELVKAIEDHEAEKKAAAAQTA